ncbi:MAG: hypothetical protein CL931_12620 [Deltaproteobacteria bacterium]|nr:hypothetical protein [Deltaproteobacteria bacterium]
MTEIEIVGSASSGREARLQRAILGLAENPPGAEEAKRRPARPGFAENLVFEFDEAYTAYVESFETLPSEEQLLALQAVDTHVSRMVRAKDAELWTERARREEAPWAQVRELAAHVLRVFEWRAP